MGKIQVNQKSRKETKCGKCRTVIPVGSKYYKGVLNFQRPIIRCAKCGLKSYEVTTSDYIRNVGAIVEDWHEDYEIQSGVWEAIADDLETIKDECEERLYNMPEQLQEADSGLILQERIDTLDSAIDSLRDGDMNEFLTDALNAVSDKARATIEAAGDEDCYEDWYEEFFAKGSEAAAEWQEAAEEAIAEFINENLSEISY